MGYPFHIYKLLFICPHSKWRAERMVPQVWLIRYRRTVCFSFYIRFISESCPWFLHFDSIASCLHPTPRHPKPTFSPFPSPAFGFMAKPRSRGFVCVCVCLSVYWEWGVGGPPGGLLCCHLPPLPACVIWTVMTDWERTVWKCCLLPHERKCLYTVSLD